MLDISEKWVEFRRNGRVLKRGAFVQIGFRQFKFFQQECDGHLMLNRCTDVALSKEADRSSVLQAARLSGEDITILAGNSPEALREQPTTLCRGGTSGDRLEDLERRVRKLEDG